MSRNLFPSYNDWVASFNSDNPSFVPLAKSKSLGSEEKLIVCHTDSDFLNKLSQSEKDTNTNPTEAQKKEGTYAKGRFQHQGITFIIENPKGTYRKGVDSDGTPWQTLMNNTYGYFGEAKGVDKDKLDFFIGPYPISGYIFVIAQNNSKGEFDEHKVMYGFKSFEEAKQAYLSNYSKDWKGFRLIRLVDFPFFKDEFMKHSSNKAWLNKHNFI